MIVTIIITNTAIIVSRDLLLVSGQPSHY